MIIQIGTLVTQMMLVQIVAGRKGASVSNLRKCIS